MRKYKATKRNLLHSRYIAVVEEAAKAASVFYGVDEHELFSAGAEAMIHAVNRALNRWSTRFTDEAVTASIREAVVATAKSLVEYSERLDVVADIDGVAGDVANSVITEIVFTDEIELLKKAINELPERHRMVIVKRYGIGGATKMTLEEIGRRINRTGSRARSLELEALEMLRAAFYPDSL